MVEEKKVTGKGREYIEVVGSFEHISQYLLDNEEADLINIRLEGEIYTCLLFKRC